MMKRECIDCAWFTTCQWLIQRTPIDTECDWSPSRWHAKVTPLPPNPVEYVPGEDAGLENEANS